MPANSENSVVATGLERSVFFPILKKGSAEECSNYGLTVFPTFFNLSLNFASKVMLKLLQARFQQYVNQELPYAQAEFKKDRRTRDQIANIRWIIEKTREF